jgi:hypothetical protein
VVTLTDTTPPTVRIVSAGHRIELGRTFRVHWTGRDVGSGIASYDVEYATAAWNKRFAKAAVWRSADTGTSARFAGTPGTEYCFRVRARDHSGNLSGWSPPRCTALPLDDRGLISSAGWARISGRHFYQHTALQAVQRGATLRAAHAMPGRAALLIDRGKNYGRVAVRYNGRIVKTVKLAGRSRDAMAVALPDITKRTKITITTTSSKPVRIDGLWLAPTP